MAKIVHMSNPGRRARFAVVIVPLLVFGQDQPKLALISIDAAHTGAAIAPTLFGIFFEDINFGADGGLYPELVKTAPSSSRSHSLVGTRF